MRRKLTAALLLVALGSTSASAEIQLGQFGPNFTKFNVDGGLVSLSDYSGKVVVLFLFGWT